MMQSGRRSIRKSGEKSSSVELPISIKSIIQLVLLLTSLVIVFYVYHMRTRKMRNVDEFLR